MDNPLYGMGIMAAPPSQKNRKKFDWSSGNELMH